MSKNKSRQHLSETEQQAEVETPTTTTVKPKEEKREAAEYMITSQSRVQFDTPITEIYNGNVAEWIKNNPKRYISFIIKI